MASLTTTLRVFLGCKKNWSCHLLPNLCFLMTLIHSEEPGTSSIEMLSVGVIFLQAQKYLSKRRYFLNSLFFTMFRNPRSKSSYLLIKNVLTSSVFVYEPLLPFRVWQFPDRRVQGPPCWTSGCELALGLQRAGRSPALECTTSVCPSTTHAHAWLGWAIT